MQYINGYERKGNNLYKKNGKYYRLFGKGITPNACWIVSPKMVELTDIEISTGNDVYGKEIVDFLCTTISAPREYVKY